jgi:heme/copper-type cytochrome/quinol oxidase subunit 1
MSMHTPSDWTFWLSVALVALAIVAWFVHIPTISEYGFWVAVIGYIILVVGCRVKTKRHR